MNLIITGNGFDISFLHSVDSKYDTSYQSIIKSKEFSKCLEYLEKIIPISEEELWTDFEEAIGNVDIEHFLEHCSDCGAFNDYTSDDWSDADHHWHSQVSEVKDEYKRAFIEYFNNNILEALKSPSIKIEGDFEAITFNYTPTLEALGIESVQYIHGKLTDGDNIVLGHNKEKIRIESEDIERTLEYYEARLSEMEFESIYDQIAGIDPRVIEAKDDFAYWFNNMKKDIKSNFSKLKLRQKYGQIFICGVSYNEIDYEYFELLFKNIQYEKVTLCVFSYDDSINAKQYQKKLKLKNCKILLVQDFAKYINLFEESCKY